MGPGRRVIDHAWASSSDYAILLTGALVEMQWGGFKQFGLPPVLKNVALGAEVDEKQRLNVLRLLAKLVAEGMLDSVDSKWKEGIENWLQVWLENFTMSETCVSYIP